MSLRIGGINDRSDGLAYSPIDKGILIGQQSFQDNVSATMTAKMGRQSYQDNGSANSVLSSDKEASDRLIMVGWQSYHDNGSVDNHQSPFRWAGMSIMSGPLMEDNDSVNRDNISVNNVSSSDEDNGIFT
ncbi:hypothetical protein DPMN_072489 [Dreissena polymorpha]|uniref:Uncharacterized protein n=1 Tax=Dreissena polymorpha TaxID=45954 RepID=A0A9D3Z6B6_DREPO|nr:hypothetical protein DPMN_072489 [Dreissena polymorpha]